MSDKFLEMQNVGVKAGAAYILENINLVIHSDEQWAIIGPSGSGKTALAHTFSGKYFYSGKIDCFFPVKKNGKSSIAIVEQQHHFKNLSNTNDLYYQQRFNSSDAEQTITVEQELKEYAGDENFILNEWIDILHVRSLLKKPLIQLSNGENKRTQLAIALLENPALLILDNPFTGLDAEGRQTLNEIINTISKKRIHVLLIASQNEIPGSITHIAYLEKGKLVFAGRKEDFHFQQSAYAADKLDAGVLQQ